MTPTEPATRRPSRRLAATAALALVVALLPIVHASPAAAATGETWLCKRSDYGCLSGTGYTGQSVWGSWGPGHNCVSYAAYRLSQNGAAKPWAGRIGNANEWDEFARGAGIRVDRSPNVGSIAQWDTGGNGHIAYVEVVTSSYIEVTEDAYLSDTSGYSARRRLDRSGTTFQAAEFIHIRDVGGGVSEGSFISHGGHVYRIAGGAPVYVSSWNQFGGPQPTTPVGSLASFRQHPADGTFVVAAGNVYRFAGGAPIYVSNWNTFGGAQPTVAVDSAALDNAGGGPPWDHVRATPADGTAVSANGDVFVFAGGAPLYVSSWAAIGGERATTRVDRFSIDHAGEGGVFRFVRSHPADGTYVSGGGQVHVFAGGAPLYVSNWASVGGDRPTTAVDRAALENGDGSSPWNHIRRVPADGTFVTGVVGTSTYTYRFLGGAPTYIASWAAVGGQQSSTRIDHAALDNAGGAAPWSHVHPFPADGSWARIGNGTVYRAAGGALLPIESWVPFGGSKPTTLIDPGAVTNAGRPLPWNHVRRAPADGTVLRGLPSGQLWRVSSGRRTATVAANGAIDLTDAAVATLPLTTSVSAFGDVPATAYYAADAAWLKERGITTGWAGDPNTFAPDVVVTRAQMATFLWRMSGSPAATGTGFADVPAGTYYATAVAWLKTRGVLTGYAGDPNRFAPDEAVTRAQMATFLWRLAGQPAAGSGGFTDVPAGTSYATAANWLKATGITTGYAGNTTTFAPTIPVTRAQMAAFLHRYDTAT